MNFTLKFTHFNEIIIYITFSETEFGKYQSFGFGIVNPPSEEDKSEGHETDAEYIEVAPSHQDERESSEGVEITSFAESVQGEYNSFFTIYFNSS